MVKPIRQLTEAHLSTFWLMSAAFLCYTGMYAVRKAFLAGQYEGVERDAAVLEQLAFVMAGLMLLT